MSRASYLGSTVGSLLLASLTALAPPASAQTGYRAVSAEWFQSQSASRRAGLFTTGFAFGFDVTTSLAAEVQPKLVVVRGDWQAASTTDPAHEADGVGAGGSLLGRWTPVRTDVVEPYLDVSFGILLTSDRLPPTGTAWNFWTRWGAGLSIHLPGDAALRVGLRRIHISNGGTLTRQSHNPGYDGEGVIIAVRL